jgi:hypothetical protein
MEKMTDLVFECQNIRKPNDLSGFPMPIAIWLPDIDLPVTEWFRYLDVCIRISTVCT